ncbi:MAG: hypothetical protein KGJ62_11225 [Armatimonadetes bacterium]|nr:hypothetical protein [Armatimonadota bacterium]MDE2206298.1 hypothetical protein [Armatimonadota bacterium]
MTALFPTVREREVELPDGTRITVRGLNALQRDEARENAELAALLQLARWATGTPAAAALEARFAALDARTQAHYLAANAAVVEEWLLQAEDQFPAFSDDASVSLDSRLAAAVKSAAEDPAAKREAWLRSKYEASVESGAARPDGERCRMCAAAWRERQYRDRLTARFAVEVIVRAARCTEDPARPFYQSVEAVAELDDATMAALCRAYRETDPVNPQQIPTSRSGS